VKTPGCADPKDFSKRFLETPGGVAEKRTSREFPPRRPEMSWMIVRSLDTAASIGCTIEVIISMRVEEVQALVRSQCAGNLIVKNDHRIGLEQAIVPPHRTLVVWRTVENGNLRDT
jgi:hypothetical protein